MPPLSTDKLTEYQAQWESRQPDELNYLRPNGFKFVINTLPKVTYFCQAANLPTMNLGVAMQSTPLVDIPWPGEKVDFGELNIRFMIQEDMSNYTELYNWIIGLGFPDNREQFKKYVDSHAYNFPGVPSKSGDGQFSDATLVILGSNNVAVAQILFTDCFPTSLSGLDFDSTLDSLQYFQAQATFRFRSFQIEYLGNPTLRP